MSLMRVILPDNLDSNQAGHLESGHFQKSGHYCSKSGHFSKICCHFWLDQVNNRLETLNCIRSGHFFYFYFIELCAIRSIRSLFWPDRHILAKSGQNRFILRPDICFCANRSLPCAKCSVNQAIFPPFLLFRPDRTFLCVQSVHPLCKLFRTPARHQHLSIFILIRASSSKCVPSACQPQSSFAHSSGESTRSWPCFWMELSLFIHSVSQSERGVVPCRFFCFVLFLSVASTPDI